MHGAAVTGIMTAFMTRGVPFWATVAAAGLMLGCGDGDDPHESRWQVVHRELPGALLSVWGTTASDVWAVGGDPGDGLGPMVLHYDGESWSRLETGHTGDLWWTFGFAGGPLFMGGAGGAILRYEAGELTPMTTPGTDTVFGIWGSSPTEMWAVGGASGGSQGAFAWRLEGDEWVVAPGFPAELADRGAIWKVYGRGTDDVWLVGTAGLVLHWDGTSFSTGNTGGGESLFTVHANGDRFVAVGGFGTGIVLEHDGTDWVDMSPDAADPLVGVCLTPNGGTAVGQYGAVFERGAGGWQAEDTGFLLDETLHSVWIDPDGGRWAVGGQVFAFPLVRGVMLHHGPAVPEGGI